MFEDLFGWRDFGFGWLQDRSGGWCWPVREGLAEVAVAGVCGRDGQALPFGEPLGERSGRKPRPEAMVSVSSRNMSA